jgi:L-lactate dehydrogenase complex protein LldE
MRIALFIACYNDALFPSTGIAVTRVLERLGHSVSFLREQSCCGQMHANTGYRESSHALARRWVMQYRDAEAVCIPSSSCVAMVRDQYLPLAQEYGDTEMEAALIGLLPRVWEFAELLVRGLDVTDVGAYFPHTVTYHASCHGLRSLHLGTAPMQLLQRVKGLKLKPIERMETCCGFGGTFAVKNAAVSTAMLDEKIASIRETGASICTACDNSCLMHIAGRLHREADPVQTLHLAEILASTVTDPWTGGATLAPHSDSTSLETR